MGTSSAAASSAAGGIFQVGTSSAVAWLSKQWHSEKENPPQGGRFSGIKSKRTNETRPRTFDLVSARARRHPQPAATQGARRRVFSPDAAACHSGYFCNAEVILDFDCTVFPFFALCFHLAGLSRSFSFPLFFSFALSLSFSLSFSFFLSLSLSLSLCPSVSLSLLFSLSFTFSFSLSRCLFFFLSLSPDRRDDLAHVSSPIDQEKT